MVATCNWVVGALATVCIACVSVCVLGLIPCLGWKVDVMISMNLCLLVGLSVDYIVHVAEAYTQSHCVTREARMRDSVGRLGTSVLCGAATTLGAAVFMLACKLQFFLQFGAFLLSVVGFSLLFALVFFPVVMSLVGPQRDAGSLTVLLSLLKRRVTGRTRSDVDCNACAGKGFLPLEADVDDGQVTSRL